MINPFRVYEPRKNKILPYYNNQQVWNKEIDKWKKKYYENPKNFDQDDLDDFFYSVFSTGDYNSYKEVALTIDKEKTNFFQFHNSTASAIALYKQGKYLEANKYITQAVISKEKENRYHSYIFQIRKENLLKIRLEKTRGVKRKKTYLNTKYFEISGNIFYSTDLKGTCLLTNILKNDHYEFKEINILVSYIYEKIKYFKGNMSLYESKDLTPQIEQLHNNLIRLGDKKKLISGIHWIILMKTIALTNNIKQFYTVREIAKSIFIENKEKYKEKHKVFSLYALRSEIEHCENRYLDSNQEKGYEIALAYANLLNGNQSIFNKEIKQHDKTKDISYREFIENKRVAIVGPVECDGNNGEEIDTFDIVIRLNLLDINIYNKDKFGRKADVIFYARECLIQHYSQIIEKHSNNKYICFNSYEDDPLINKTEKYKKTRQIINYSERRNNILFSGYTTHIQRAIFDTLRFKPKEIKIFNTNLWLDIKENNHYIYQQKFDNTILILHDIFSNFSVMRNLHNSGQIKADETLKKILEMKPSEYSDKMHQRHNLNLRI